MIEGVSRGCERCCEPESADQQSHEGLTTERVVSASWLTKFAGMAKEAFDDYGLELANQREVWLRKPALRAIYETWYSRIISALSDCRPVVEIGAGCGNFKDSFPEVIATDAIDTGPWIDRVIDARALPFEVGEVGNFGERSGDLFPTEGLVTDGLAPGEAKEKRRPGGRLFCYSE